MLSRFSRSFLLVALALLVLFSLALFHPPSRTYFDPISGAVFGEGGVERDLAQYAAKPAPTQQEKVPEERIPGVIMPKLANATAKAELGRATWRLMHTMTLRFPEEPTQDERTALNDYFYLMSKLYPCGDCASHFQKLLAEFPPQTSSRKAASNWLCHVHNQVNERLGKPEFDCAYLGDTYDCGCGPEKPGATSVPLSEDDALAVRGG
ncbi:hypothetical protein EXIGLDRAFT_762703 [Exidia glandulosa HHB12029]|uniref:Sulfhydryl oxidase n=1 Tax=Exidia glandulosa HHB12029 TaxID=1314781 RepID=A0A166BAH6_EXIGL|nr:hypothetical protein EXIGLDRAFT_762703 [Exidia glandulosa HHB12029]